jgi:hypothetical protein
MTRNATTFLATTALLLIESAIPEMGAARFAKNFR